MKEIDDEIFEGSLTCVKGHTYAIKRAIPRFITSVDYVENFSFEWRKFSKIQLDKFNHSTQSEDTFMQDTGFTREALSGKLILDAGIGAGRFAEVVTRWGGEVVGVDLSYAVDAAYDNIGERRNLHIIQADILHLPFREGIFDYVFSIGVLHHTPDTKRAFTALIPLLKTNGEIAIWVYAKYYENIQKISTMLRAFTTRMPKKLIYYLSSISIPLYYSGPLRGILFPLLQLSLHKTARWRWLDTFDWYSPKYAWKHTYPEVFVWFKEAGLKEITPLAPPVAMKGRK